MAQTTLNASFGPYLVASTFTAATTAAITAAILVVLFVVVVVVGVACRVTGCLLAVDAWQWW